MGGIQPLLASLEIFLALVTKTKVFIISQALVTGLNVFSSVYQVGWEVHSGEKLGQGKAGARVALAAPGTLSQLSLVLGGISPTRHLWSLLVSSPV